MSEDKLILHTECIHYTICIFLGGTMKLRNIIDILDAKLVTGEKFINHEIAYAYSCDLMSDVLAFVQNDVVLMTGLVHPQVIRTAEMLDIMAIVIVRGKSASEEVVQMAKERGIVLIETKYSLFTASGLLYKEGLIGEEITHDEITI